MLKSKAGNRPVRLWRSSFAQRLLRNIKSADERTALGRLMHLEISESELKKWVKQYRVKHLPSETITEYLARHCQSHQIRCTEYSKLNETMKFKIIKKCSNDQ